jgi:DNA-binding NtrC family response regulator
VSHSPFVNEERFGIGCRRPAPPVNVNSDSPKLQGSRILIVDDLPANLDVLRESLELGGYQVQVVPSGERALTVAAESTPDLILLDVVMPGLNGYEVCRKLKEDGATVDIPVVFLTAKDEAEDLVEGFQAGGIDYIAKPFRAEEVLVRVENHLMRSRLARELAEKNDALERANRDLEAEMERRERLTKERNHLADRVADMAQREAERLGVEGFVGQSRSLRKILEDVERLQSSAASVLITGESGTGKELVARAFHVRSARAEGPFLPVNCASIPRELADSLFFGHVKGAFTGADKDQTGYFELADGGTLFLDEVGDMPAELQTKLLRVLEDSEVMPLGARQGKPIDVRIVAATNTDLQASMSTGSFREDLYYRLARFTVEVPPLRERQDDVPLLVQHFSVLFGHEMGMEPPAWTAEAMAVLEAYSFPGNIRELKNIVERALIESAGAEIRSEHLHLRTAGTSSAETQVAKDFVAGLPLDFQQAEVALIQRAMAETDGNITEAARLLGINRTKIYRKLAQIDAASD